MKKISLSLLASAFMVTSVNAAQVLDQKTDSYGYTEYIVKCDNGRIISVTQVRDTYASNGRGGFFSLSDAASYGCGS